MEALILAGGFATRLRPLTERIPKSLLPICGRKIIDEQVERFVRAGVASISVITNERFSSSMEEWRRGSPHSGSVRVIGDGIAREEDRRGAVGDLHFFLRAAPPGEDLLVLGSDNLFSEPFNGILSSFSKMQDATVVAVHHLRNANVSQQPNEVILDNAGRLLEFRERPQMPSSPLFASLFYLFPRSMLRAVDEYVKSGKDLDHAGALIAWMVETGYSVFGYEMPGRRFDIGDHDAYIEALARYPCVPRVP